MKQKQELTASEQLKKERQLFEFEPVHKALITLILPTIISQIVHVVYNMADTWFVGLTEDAAAVAALSVCFPLYSFMTCVSNLFGLGGAGVLSRNLGAKRYENVKRTFSAAMWCSVGAALLISVLMLLFGRGFLLSIGGDESSIGFALTYALFTVTLGGIPTILATTLSHLVRALGEAGKAGFGLTFGAVLNIGLDPLFMFVIFPKGNEVLGAAVATFISNIISMIYFLAVVQKLRRSAVISMDIRLLKGSGSLVAEIVKTGLPGFVMALTPQISVSMVNSIVGGQWGAAAVAGMGITRKIDSLAFSVNQGITQGVLSFIAYNYAAGHQDRMKKAIKIATASSVIFSLCTSTISMLFAENLIRLFIRDAETITYGASFLRILCISIPIYSITYIVIATFQATGRIVPPLILALRRGVLDTIMFFTVGHIFGMENFLWGSPVAETIAMAASVILLIRLLKKIKNEKHLRS